MKQQKVSTFRQGDVLVQRIDDRARSGKDVSEGGRIVLAHGEVTGHAHQVVEAGTKVDDTPAAAFFEEPDGTRVLFVNRPCSLIHQEHGPIALAPGCYKVVRQREYVAPELNRSVAD
jgi:hypothetical protein